MEWFTKYQPSFMQLESQKCLTAGSQTDQRQYHQHSLPWRVSGECIAVRGAKRPLPGRCRLQGTTGQSDLGSPAQRFRPRTAPSSAEKKSGERVCHTSRTCRPFQPRTSAQACARCARAVRARAAVRACDGARAHSPLAQSWPLRGLWGACSSAYAPKQPLNHTQVLLVTRVTTPVAT